MSYVVLTKREREELVDLFFRLRHLGEQYPDAREEAQTALRCLKAIHSNAIEDKAVDRIFLQVLMHGAGIHDKSKISSYYGRASNELRGQEECLLWLEKEAEKKEPFSISMILEMHHRIFKNSIPDMAGKFRETDVRISGMVHVPPLPQQVPEALHQQLSGINDELLNIEVKDEESFLNVLRISAQMHYLIASVHPFEDGNGRVSRAAGNYVMLLHDLYYDVIMTDYRDVYLDSLESSTWADTTPVYHFIEYSYLETLRRISGFFSLIGRNG